MEIVIVVALVKKLVLTVDLHGLKEQAKLQRFTDLQAAHQANIAWIPGLTPTPSAVATAITAAKGMLTSRNSLREQLKQITEQYHLAEKSLTDIFISWMAQAQLAISGDTTKAKALGYGEKGPGGKHPINDEIEPVIVKIDINVRGVHKLHIRDSITNKRKLPAGIGRIDIYGQTGGDAPIDLAHLIMNGGGYLGEASKGDYVNDLPTGNVGKSEYYIAVYIGKKTKKPVAQSVVASAMIN